MVSFSPQTLGLGILDGKTRCDMTQVLIQTVAKHISVPVMGPGPRLLLCPGTSGEALVVVLKTDTSGGSWSNRLHLTGVIPPPPPLDDPLSETFYWSPACYPLPHGYPCPSSYPHHQVSSSTHTYQIVKHQIRV